MRNQTPAPQAPWAALLNLRMKEVVTLLRGDLWSIFRWTWRLGSLFIFLALSHLSLYDFGSVSSWSLHFPHSLKAKSLPSIDLPVLKDEATSWPQSQPSVSLEILPEVQVDVISSQDGVLLPVVTSSNLNCKSSSCFHAARTCGVKKQFAIAGAFIVGPRLMPLQQGFCSLTPSSFNKQSLHLQGFPGFSTFIHSTFISRPSCLCSATFP